jgi:hypothetical protein
VAELTDGARLPGALPPPARRALGDRLVDGERRLTTAEDERTREFVARVAGDVRVVRPPG